MSDLPKPAVNPDGSVNMPVWTRRGKMLIRRDALDLDDPEHPLNELAKLGLDALDYGYSRRDVVEWEVFRRLRSCQPA